MFKDFFFEFMLCAFEAFFNLCILGTLNKFTPYE